jgi:hypothetical protein
MHGMALDLRTSSDTPKNKEWVQTALTLLRLHIDSSGLAFPTGEGGNEGRMENIVQGLVEAAKALDDGNT